MAVLGRVVCPHCGKLTIKGRYCMNCGKELEAPPAQVTTPVTPQPEAPPITVTPGPAQPTPPPEQRPVSGEAVQPSESVRETAAEEIAEERRVVEQLSKLYNWQIKLINLFLEGESTPEIFVEIYSDYESRIKALNEKRLEMIGRYEARMKELTQRLETLKLRHEVSEISQREYIRQKIEIDNELSKLKPKLAVLQNPIEIKIGEIPKFREEILRLIESVKTKGPQLNLPQEFVKGREQPERAPGCDAGPRQAVREDKDRDPEAGGALQGGRAPPRGVPQPEAPPRETAGAHLLTERFRRFQA